MVNSPTYRVAAAVYEVAKLVLPTPVVAKINIVAPGEETTNVLTEIIGLENIPTFYDGSAEHTAYRSLPLAEQMAIQFAEGEGACE